MCGLPVPQAQAQQESVNNIMTKWLDKNFTAPSYARRPVSRRAVTKGVGSLVALGAMSATLGLSGCTQQKTSDAVLRTPETRFVNLPDYDFAPHYARVPSDFGPLRMHYVDEGPANADVILLLHGQGAWAYSYRAMIPPLVKAGYRVIAPDYVGFGRSDKLKQDQDYTYQSHVDWLRSFLHAKSFKNVTAFMYDWGGYFGLRVAAAEPALFNRLVLSNTQLPMANQGGMEWFIKFREKILSAPQFPMGKMVNRGCMNKLTPEEIAAYDAPYPDESYKTGPRRFPMILPTAPGDPTVADNKAAWKKLASWKKPVLTLFSEQTAKTAMGPEVFFKQIPGTQGQDHALLKAGFSIMEDQPQQLATRIIAFAGSES